MECQIEDVAEVPVSDNMIPNQSPIEKLPEDYGNELTELSGAIGLVDDPNKSTSSSLLTMCHSWVAKKKSHSIVNMATSIKSRNNPGRGQDSLTARERAYIHHTEENNTDDTLDKLLGFECAYGHTGKDLPGKTSIPMNRGEKNVADRAERVLLDYLDSDKIIIEDSATPQTRNEPTETTRRPDTPIPPQPVTTTAN